MTIAIGETTEVYAYDVHPSDLEIKFSITGPIKVVSKEVDKCPALSSADGYPESHNEVDSSFTAEGCAPGGRATVKLLVRSSNFELDRTNIYVEAYTPTSTVPPTAVPPTPVPPTPTDTPTPDTPTPVPPTQTPVPEVEIRSLKESMKEGTSHDFEVRASNLSPSLTYRIEMRMSNDDIGFRDNCSKSRKHNSEYWTGEESYTEPPTGSPLTLHACDTTGGTVYAYLKRVREEQDDDVENNLVRVTEATWEVEVTDTSGPSDPPDPPDPPPSPTGLTSTAHSTGKIVLDWDDVPGGVTYEVQQKKPKWMWPDDWITLPFDRFTIAMTGSGALIGELQFDKSYEHRVRASRGGQASAWSESFKTKVPLPYIGHQADHTVKYRIGALPPAGTQTPRPAVVILTAITSATAEWNKAVATPAPEVLFCVEGSCNNRNTDGRTVTIYAGAVSCGFLAVCLAPADGFNFTDFFDKDGHMKDLLIVIEEPAWMGRTPYYWTNDPDQHRKIFGTGLRYYLPAVFMHEFGHPAGLHDLYKFETYSGHVMWSPDYEKFELSSFSNAIVPHTSIPDKDRDHMRDLYRNHTPHPTPTP